MVSEGLVIQTIVEAWQRFAGKWATSVSGQKPRLWSHPARADSKAPEGRLEGMAGNYSFRTPGRIVLPGGGDFRRVHHGAPFHDVSPYPLARFRACGINASARRFAWTKGTPFANSPRCQILRPTFATCETRGFGSSGHYAELTLYGRTLLFSCRYARSRLSKRKRL